MTTFPLLIAIGLFPGVAQAPASIQSLVQTGLHDATFTARVIVADQMELKKINKDFGQSYRFGSTSILFKEPLKIRVEAVVEDTHILYIMNGAIQTIKIPRAHINSHQNLAKKPGRRQTPLDFGMLTPSLFGSDLFQPKFVRWDRASGDAVFDLTYPATLDDSSRQRIWVDTKRNYIAKREWYNQEGRQLATFFYENPKLEGGIWMPTKLTVRNVDNKVAGVTAYDSVKVNTGISDDEFGN